MRFFMSSYFVWLRLSSMHVPTCAKAPITEKYFSLPPPPPPPPPPPSNNQVDLFMEKEGELLQQVLNASASEGKTEVCLYHYIIMTSYNDIIIM